MPALEQTLRALVHAPQRAQGDRTTKRERTLLDGPAWRVSWIQQWSWGADLLCISMLEQISGRREDVRSNCVQVFQEPQKSHCNPQSLKRRQLVLFSFTGVLPSSFKSIFLKKSPLIYVLQDILLNDVQLTEEFYPNNTLTIYFFQNKVSQFKTEAKTFLQSSKSLFVCVPAGKFLFVLHGFMEKYLSEDWML